MQRLHAEKLNLVSSVEAEEKCMLEALTQVDNARKASNTQLEMAEGRIQELERQNRWLAACLEESQTKAAEAAAGEGRASKRARDLHEREKIVASQMAILQSTEERQRAELQALNAHVDVEASETERKIEVLLDEITRWKAAASERDFELQETHQKMAFQHERYQELTVRHERMEAALNSTREAFQESKHSRATSLAGKDSLHKQEVEHLNSLLRAADNKLHEFRDHMLAELASQSDEAKREASMRKEAEARDEASKAIVRELNRKFAASEAQVSELRRRHEQLSQLLSENEVRLRQALAEVEEGDRKVKALNGEAFEREECLKKSRNEVRSMCVWGGMRGGKGVCVLCSRHLVFPNKCRNEVPAKLPPLRLYVFSLVTLHCCHCPTLPFWERISQRGSNGHLPVRL